MRIIYGILAVACFPAALAGEIGQVIYRKSLNQDLLVEVVEAREEITGKEMSVAEIKRLQARREELVAENLKAGSIAMYDHIHPVPRTGAARTYTVMLSRRDKGEPHTVWKRQQFVEDDFGPRGKEPAFTFKVYDATLGDGTMTILFSDRGRVGLVTVRLEERATSKTEWESWAHLFDYYPHPGSGPVKSATILPASGAAYVFYVTERGKRALWEVKGNEGKMVWESKNPPEEEPAAERP